MPAQQNQTCAVIGLGYVGLPLALLASSKGWQVLGVDNDQAKVDQINRGQSPIADPELIKQLSGYPFTATTDPRLIADASVIIVAVPTPVTASKEPDLAPLTSALSSLLPHLTSGQTIVIESTINPGVMDEVVKPLIAQSRPHLDVHLAHCPERINPADPKWNVRNIPRVLGAYTIAGTRAAHNFYASILDAEVRIMGSPMEAEAVKILENTFRDVNIAFINEMAKSFDALNINILNVIAGAATKPFGFLPHYPGNGVGGHCISVDPYYMIARARAAGFDHKFLKLARQINDSMPAYTVDLLSQALTSIGLDIKNTSVAVLGVAYKKNVADTRESPALATLEILTSLAAVVHVFDPLVPKYSTTASLTEALEKSEAILLACDHDQLITKLTPQVLADNNIKVVIDGKNSLDPVGLTKSNIVYHGVGRSAPARGD